MCLGQICRVMLCVVHPPPPDTAKPITWTTNYRFSSNTIACSARRCTRQYIEQVGASQLPLFGCVGWWRVHHTTLELYLRDLDPTVTCDSRHCAGRDSRRVFNTSHVSSTWPNGATEFVGLPPDGDVEDGAMTQQIRASTHPRIDPSAHRPIGDVPRVARGCAERLPASHVANTGGTNHSPPRLERNRSRFVDRIPTRNRFSVPSSLHASFGDAAAAVCC